MPETWGWVPEFYIKTRRYQAHPGLLSTSKAEGYLQYYQSYKRCLLPVTTHSQWTEANGRKVRFKVGHPRSPIVFMPGVDRH